jgi:hypothetical protein
MLYAIFMMVATFQTEACSRQIYLCQLLCVSMLWRSRYVFPRWREHGTQLFGCRCESIFGQSTALRFLTASALNPDGRPESSTMELTLDQ